MTKSKRPTHFVPKVVFRTAFAGVVPVCVAGIACGGSQTTQGGSGSSTSNVSTSSTFFGVAASCFGPACPGSSTVSTSSTLFAVTQSCFGTPYCPGSSSTGSPMDAAPDHTILTGDADAAGDVRGHDSGDSG